MARRVVVVGGGLAGLVVGQRLASIPALELTVLETERRPGGKALTDVVPAASGRWLLEWGPQTLLVEPAGALVRAIADAGLRTEVLQARAESRRRLVLWEGALRPVPRSLSSIVGVTGALRAFAEPLLGAGPPAGDESVQAFAARRFGVAVADRLVGAFVTGIFAGDPARLSVRSAFPRLAALERDHGSVLRGALRGGAARRDTITLRRGAGSLTDGLARALGPALRLGAPATELVRDGAGWRVETPGGALAADAVVLATPAFAASYLLRPTDAPLADALAAIPYAPVAAVALGYREAAFEGGPPQGFGFLVPRGQARVLGCLFPTSIAAGASPPEHVLLRVLVGGALDPEGASLPEAELVALCRREVEPLVGLRDGEPPVLTRVFRHARAIPQYELGHADRLAAIEARRATLPGLFLAGNAYRGVSLGDVCEDAERVAAEVGRSLT